MGKHPTILWKKASWRFGEAESDGTRSLDNTANEYLLALDKKNKKVLAEGTNSEDLRTGYQQLVNQSLALDKKNKQLKQEIGKLEGGSSSAILPPKPSAMPQKSLLAAAMIALIVSAVFRYMF